MKFSMDETMKHRVIGITVILSIAAVFVPAMLKKSSQRMDDREISILLPAKPQQIATDTVNEERIFKSVKVAHVELPAVDTQRSDTEYDNAIKIGKPELLRPVEKNHPNAETTQLAANKSRIVASSTPRTKTSQLVSVSHAVPSAHSNAAIRKQPAKHRTKTLSGNGKQTSPVPEKSYAVQVGVFSEEHNAQTLLNSLQSKGFSAEKSLTQKNGTKIYKVTVGKSIDKKQAEKLKQRLLTQVRIKGFIVEKGVA